MLLVEDNLDVQRLISLMLKNAGAKVKCAGDGPAALDMILGRAARGVPFDLVLLDLGLPSMDGLEVLKTVRNRHYRGRIAVLTASTTEVDACFKAGCDDYLTKPVDRATFVPRCLDLVFAHAPGQPQQRGLGASTKPL